jgi:hypothetical protein
MRKALSLTLAAVLAVVATPALAEKTAPAGKVFMFLDKFQSVPPAERARLKLAYGIRHDGKMAPNLKATLVEKTGARTPLPINGEGYFERLPTPAQLNGDPTIVFDVPADWKMGTLVDFSPQLKPAAEYDVRDLNATVAEANSVIGKAGGMISFMIPKMTGIAFEKGDDGVVIFADGHTAPLPEINGGPYFRPTDHQGAVRVKLTKTPTKVAFYQGKK